MHTIFHLVTTLRTLLGCFRLYPLRFHAAAFIVASVCSVPAHTIEYTIEPCCAPCAAAQNPANYDTSYLKLFRQLVQGNDGWLFRTENDLITEFGPSPETWPQLQEFTERLKEKGSQLVMLFIPTKGMVHPEKIPARFQFDNTLAIKNYRQAIQDFRKVGIVTPDLSPLAAEPPSENAFYFMRDHHWTPYGARRAAELIANHIKQHPLYPGLQKQQFSTEKVGLMRKQGTLQVAWQKLCDARYSLQYVDEFATQEVEQDGDNALSADDLFGDAGSQLPEITLVGTSFSKSAVNYNFVGKLKEELQVDVLNEALAGGSYDGAMVQYLPSDEFQQSPPTFLLWEIPGYHTINSEEFYQQANAYLENGCHGKPAVLQNTLTLGKNGVETEILFNGGGQYREFRGENRIIDIQFENPDVKKIDTEVWFTNGRKDRIKIAHADRVNNNGRFMFYLKEREDWKTFNFMSLLAKAGDEDAKSSPGKVTVTACYSKDR